MERPPQRPPKPRRVLGVLVLRVSPRESVGAVEHDACHDEHLFASVLRATGGLVLPMRGSSAATIRRKTCASAYGGAAPSASMLICVAAIAIRASVEGATSHAPLETSTPKYLPRVTFLPPQPPPHSPRAPACSAPPPPFGSQISALVHLSCQGGDHEQAFCAVHQATRSPRSPSLPSNRLSHLRARTRRG